MKNAINSDCYEAVSIMKTIMEDNKVPVTEDMINLALERKLTDVVETLLPGKYDMEQRKNNFLIKNKENDNITGTDELFYSCHQKVNLQKKFQIKYQKATSLNLIKTNHRNF